MNKHNLYDNYLEKLPEIRQTLFDTQLKNEYSLTYMAKEIGVDRATLTNFLKGMRINMGKAYKIELWLNQPKKEI